MMANYFLNLKSSKSFTGKFQIYG